MIMSQTSYKEWVYTSIHEGSIYCCSESDLDLDPLYIGRGAFGVVYKATIKQEISVANNIFSDTTAVAVKVLFPDNHGNCEEDLYQQFAKEVSIMLAVHFILYI